MRANTRLSFPPEIPLEPPLATRWRFFFGSREAEIACRRILSASYVLIPRLSAAFAILPIIPPIIRCEMGAKFGVGVALVWLGF
jgi:hypothetical protein